MDTPSIPNDMIKELCLKMDNETLGRYIRSSSNVYNVCKALLKGRRLASELQDHKSAMKYDIFKYIIDHDLNIEYQNIIDHRFYGIVTSLEEFTNINIRSEEAKEIYRKTGYIPIPNPINYNTIDLSSVQPEHYPYLKTIAESMMKPTKYVFGMKGSDFDIREINLDNDVWEHIPDYFSYIAELYYEMMVIRYLL